MKELFRTNKNGFIPEWVEVVDLDGEHHLFNLRTVEDFHEYYVESAGENEARLEIRFTSGEYIYIVGDLDNFSKQLWKQ